MSASSNPVTANVSSRCFLPWASALALALATPAMCQPIGVGEVVEIDHSRSFAALRMDGGVLRLIAPTGTGLRLSATDAVLGRGMIYNAYTQGPVTTLTLHGNTQVPGAPVGPPPADGMYLHGSYFDSSGFDVINRGTILQTGTSDLSLLGRTRLINDIGAEYSISGSGGVKEFAPPGGSPNVVLFLNKGLLQKAATASSVRIDLPFDQEGGRVQLFGGNLEFTRGGTHRAATFDTLTGPTHSGAISFSGAHTFSGVTTTGGNFQLLGSIALAENQPWQQDANFESRGPITIGSGSTLNNTGSFRSHATTITISDSAVVGATKLLNSGSMQLDDGGVITIGDMSTLGNTGSLGLNRASIRIGDVASGGAVATLSNRGDMTLDNFGLITIGNGSTLGNLGRLRLDGSSITIGDAASGGAAATLNNSDGVSDLKMLGASSIRIGPTGTLINGGNLKMEGTQAFELGGAAIVGTGLLVNRRGGTFEGNIARTLAPGPVAQLVSVDNSGRFIVGATNVVSVRRFDNNDGTLTVDGQLDVVEDGLRLLGGTLDGTGFINGDVFVGGGPGTASFDPGHSPGAMFIDGDFSLLPGGVLELEVEYVDGILQADQVFIGGDVLLAGQIRFLIGPDVVLSDLENLSLFGCGGCSMVYGNTFSYDFPGRPGSQIALLDSGPRIVALGEPGTTVPVPEPSMFMMMLAGISAMGVVAHRRRRMRLESAAQA